MLYSLDPDPPLNISWSLAVIEESGRERVKYTITAQVLRAYRWQRYYLCHVTNLFHTIYPPRLTIHQTPDRIRCTSLHPDKPYRLAAQQKLYDFHDSVEIVADGGDDIAVKVWAINGDELMSESYLPTTIPGLVLGTVYHSVTMAISSETGTDIIRVAL